MYLYVIKTGGFYRGDTLLATSYSGFGKAKNDPAQCQVAGLGPIPPGAYWINQAEDYTHMGPIAMRLIPMEGTQDFGRAGFYIHGDSIEHPGAASHGCIILPREVRIQIDEDRCRQLLVITGVPFQLKEIV